MSFAEYFKWDKTKEALRALEDLLICSICKETVDDPQALGVCKHFFCRKCINQIKHVHQCPECNVPYRPCENLEYKEIQATAVLVKEIRDIVEGKANIGKKPKIVEDTTLEEDEPIDGREIPESHPESQPENPYVFNPTLPAQKVQRRSFNPKRVRQVIEKNKQWSHQNNEQVVETGGGDGPTERGRKKRVSFPTEKKAASSESRSSSVPAAENGHIGKPKRLKTARSLSPAPKPLMNRSKQRKETERDVGTNMSKKKIVEPSNSNKLNTSASSTSSNRRSSPGNNMEKRNQKGETPLQVAAIKGNLTLVKELISQGAKPNVKDNAGWTPLHEACNHGFTEIVRVLLDAGAFMETPGGDNETPLHDAVSNYRLDIVRLLVSRGANTNARNARGETPWDLAMNDDVKQCLRTPVTTDKQTDGHTTVAVAAPFQTNRSSPVLLGTSLSSSQRAMLQQCAAVIKGKVVSEYSPHVTHLICICNKNNECTRTFKFLMAIIEGKWVMNYNWIEACVERKEYLPEEKYEVSRTSLSRLPNIGGPQRSRMNAHMQLPGLFSGCYIHFHGRFDPPGLSKKELEHLAKLGGAVVLAREPKEESIIDANKKPISVPYHADKSGSLTLASHLIIYNSDKPSIIYNMDSLKCLKYSWFLECISHFSLLEPLAVEDTN